jgi:hypothetical protein
VKADEVPRKHAMTLQRITRNRRLAPEEAARYREVREQVATELPELIARHDARLPTLALDQELRGTGGLRPSSRLPNEVPELSAVDVPTMADVQDRHLRG